MPGPSAATRSLRPRAARRRAPRRRARRRPAAVPRQPACAAATSRRSGSTSRTGRQSAVLMPRSQPGRARDRRRRPPASRPRAPRRRVAPWTCFRRRSRPFPSSARGHAGAALLAASRLRRRGPLLEAVDEAGDRGERGDGRAVRSAIADMLAAGPGLHYSAVERRRRADDGVVASGVEVVEVDGGRAPARGRGRGRSSPRGELRYARERVGPRAAPRRAARGQARRAAASSAATSRERESRGGAGRLRPAGAPAVGRGAGERLRALGASRALVSLTHERRHAAALVAARSGTRGEAGRPRRAARRAGARRRRRRARSTSPTRPWATPRPTPSTTTATRCGSSTAGSSGGTRSAEMEALFARLRARGIAYVFPHVIPFDAAGRLPRHDREQMRAFLAAARRVAPELRVLPWIGGLRKGYKRQRPGTVELGDLTQRQRIVAEARGLVDEGFDGVHLNVEPVDDGNDEYLALLRALRTAVGPGHVLSVSAIRPAPVGPAPGAELRLEPRLLRPGGRDRGPDRDHGLRHGAARPPSLYRRYVRWAARSVAGALDASGSDARVLMGVPTYEHVRLHAPARGGDAGERARRASWRGCAGSARAAPSRASRSTPSGRPTRRTGPPTSATGATARSSGGLTRGERAARRRAGSPGPSTSRAARRTGSASRRRRRSGCSPGSPGSAGRGAPASLRSSSFQK